MTTTFKIIANEKMGPTFNLERGIRQGDPVSLYIFIVCAEYLGHYINFMGKQAKFEIGIRLNKNALKIPYLVFVDDYINFCRATKKAAREC